MSRKLSPPCSRGTASRIQETAQKGKKRPQNVHTRQNLRTVEDDVLHLAKTNMGSRALDGLIPPTEIVGAGHVCADAHDGGTDYELQTIVFADVCDGGVVVRVGESEVGRGGGVDAATIGIATADAVFSVT